MDQQKKKDSTSKADNKVQRVRKVIDAHVTDEELLGFIQNDKIVLHFDEKSFKEAPSEIIRAMSHEQTRDYFIAKGHHAALEEQKRKEREGWEGLEIRELRPFQKLDGGAGDIMREHTEKYSNRVEGKGKMHVAFKRPDEVDAAERDGYKYQEVTTKRDGKTELVTMTIPEERFQEHISAVGKDSRDRIRRVGVRDKKGHIQFNRKIDREKEMFDRRDTRSFGDE